jgi:hypothetical protein
MEVFFLTVFKLAAVGLALLFARGGVEGVHEGKFKNHWGGWALTMTGSLLGFGFVCEVCDLQPSHWLPQMAAVMFVQSLAYFWWSVTIPRPDGVTSKEPSAMQVSGG